MHRYIALKKIVELGSFTKAADVLGYTQPAMSQMITSLEKELSIKLLYRSRYGIRLTIEGERLFPAKLATTSSTGGLLLALQRAIVTARPKGRYRKHFCWPAIKRYYSNLLVSILLLALLYTFELLHLLYCQSFQHNIL